MSSENIPQVMRALVVQKGSIAKVQEVPVPELADHEILIKTKATTLNPSDWKHIKLMSPPGVIPGIDFAGEVVKIGKSLDPKVSFKVGDRVSGAVHGGAYKDRGAFADFLKADAELVWKMPDELSFEDAATLNAGTLTAVQALFHPDRFGFVEPPQTVDSETWIYIHAGSTSVGINAIQLAHLAGYKVVTSASPRNHDLLRGFGADAVFDYRDRDIVSKVKQVSGDSIHYVLDCHSEEDSQDISVKILAPGKGKVIVLLMVSKPAAKLRPDVNIEVIWLYAAFGFDWPLLGIMQPASPGDRRQIADFMHDKLPNLVAEGKLKPMKIKLWENGLQDIKKGIDYMISGKLSAEKVVFRMK